MKKWSITIHPEAVNAEALAARVAAMAAVETGEAPPVDAIRVRREPPDPNGAEWLVVEERTHEIGIDADVWEEILTYVTVHPDVTVERENGVAWLRRRRILATLTVEKE